MTTPHWRAWRALIFALAALAASWSPMAAPFGLLTGLGAVVLALRAFRDGGRAAWAALATGLLAVAASATLLALAAGAGRSDEGPALAPASGERETSRRLDAAAEQSRADRERALQQLAPPPAPPPRN